MLFSTTTNTTEGIGQVVTATFSDVGLYVVFIVGIILGFFVLERILIAFFPDRYTKRENNVI
jgi:voltage-gated potassium channel Kch